MNAGFGSVEPRPTKNLASNKLVGRDSLRAVGSTSRSAVEPDGNDISGRNLGTPDTSEMARRRLLSIRGEPLFYAHWDDAIFIHYETDPQELQGCTPYHLDLYDGRAFVSLVAFTMRGMRPRFRGRIGELLLRPIATHNFLNVRTYVRHKGEPGIYFMREWLSSRMATWLGPCSFGLPYRFARIDYHRNHVILSGAKRSRRISRRYLKDFMSGFLDFARNDGGRTRNRGCVRKGGEFRRHVQAKEGCLSYRAAPVKENFETCTPGSLDEFLLERYTAFTQFGKRRRFFRIWHEPWQQVPAKIQISADDLIRSTGAWWRAARCLGANYSPGVNVWMGWPHASGDSDRHNVM
jgi:uncharacterized protein YqjF (DUF2071 family)